MLLAPLTPLAAAEGTSSAQEITEEEIVVEEQRASASASERSLDRAAVEATPGRSADDLLRAMPGLHQSAHGGRGKAYQYFLRGFDAVHGADLAVDVEGVPVNELSNVHAHGYLDLHFVPPVLVRGVALRPGTWRPEAGDFAVAGSASFQLGLETPGGLVQAGGGTDRSGQAALAWRPKGSAPGTFLVADADIGQGIGEARSWRQLRAGAGAEGSLGQVSARAWLLAYDGEFESPGVLREDDLAEGAVDFYDAYPGSGGGRSTRLLGAAQVWGSEPRLAWRATAWAGWRDFAVQQNFTGWYGDEVHGDGSLQEYSAWTSGGGARGAWSLGERLSLSSGVSLRLDSLEQREYSVETSGEIWAQRAALAAQQAALSAWLSARRPETGDPVVADGHL